MTTPSYDELAEHYTRLHRFQHPASIVGWDQAANMPPKGNEARAAALAELAALMHRMRTDASLSDRLQRAEQESLSDHQRANLRRGRLADPAAGCAHRLALELGRKPDHGRVEGRAPGPGRRPAPAAGNRPPLQTAPAGARRHPQHLSLIHI